LYEQKRPEEWNKRERIQFLLDHWDDIFAPSLPSLMASGPVSGSAHSMMPRPLPAMAHHGSVKELARCLELLLAASPGDYRHLKAFRCAAEWRQVRALIRVKLPSGREDKIPGWRRERIVPRWLSSQRISRAEGFIESVFRGDVFVPEEIWDELRRPLVSEAQ
jgi:hypothetical protein